MQPSTHVTHMPLNGLMLPGVRFLDPVAADLLILVIAMTASSFFRFPIPRQAHQSAATAAVLVRTQKKRR